MRYTIKDLAEGKCAVINDGTLEELKEVLDLAFPSKRYSVSGSYKFYMIKNRPEIACPWRWDDTTSLPTQSVKDFLIETKYKGKAVHCETQEQWDFAAEKLGRISVVKYKEYGDCIGIDNPINLTFNGCASKEFYIKNNWQVLSFQEWLEESGYTFEDKPKYIEGVWYESDCGKYYSKFLNTNDGYYYPHVFPSKEYIAITSKTHFTQGNYFNINTFTKAKLAPMQKVNKYLPKNLSQVETKKQHSWQDYKEGDYVVITEFEGKTAWGHHWFMPGEVLKLGGRYWEGSIKESFDACSEHYTKGGGMNRSFEEEYKIRKATQEEIDNSQWGTKLENKGRYVGGFDPYEGQDIPSISTIYDLDNISDIAIAVGPKTKLETIKVKRRTIIK